MQQGKDRLVPQVKEFIDKHGRNHYRQFFDALAAVPAAKVAAVIARLATGHTSGLKGLGGGLAEWRLDWGPGIRIYVHQDGEKLIVLLAGSDKGDQQKAIAMARALVTEYKTEKRVAGKAAAAAPKSKKVVPTI
jgi:putative addiction module killer protein